MASIFEVFGNGNTPVRVERDGVMLYVPFRELRGVRRMRITSRVLSGSMRLSSP